MTKQYIPELGQAMFGQPSSEFECPNFIIAGLEYLNNEIERVEGNIRQKEYYGPASNSGESYINDVFEMNAYYWGDCDCGFDNAEYDWCKNNPHTKNCFDTRYNEYEKTLGDIDFFVKNKKMTEWSLANGYKQAPFGMASNCDCGRHEKWIQWNKEYDHHPECLSIRPNFKYKDFEVRWYKYLGRGTSMNKDIDANEFSKILDNCITSVRKKDIYD